MPSVNACAYRAICYTLSTLGLLLTMHVMTEELEVYFHLGDLHSEVYEHKPKNMQAGINWPHYVNTQQGRHVHPETTLRKVTWQLRMSTISCDILIMHNFRIGTKVQSTNTGVHDLRSTNSTTETSS